MRAAKHAKRMRTAAVLAALVVGLPFSGCARAAEAAFWFIGGTTFDDIDLVEHQFSNPDENVFPLQGEVERTEDQAGYSAFANELGRVRAFVSAGSGVASTQAGMTILVWRKSFRKLAPDDAASFTVNPSNLLLLGSDLVGEISPSASMSMKVTIYDEAERMSIPPGITLDGSTYYVNPKPQVQFEHHATIRRNVQIPFISTEKTVLFGSRVYDVATDDEIDRIVQRTFTSGPGSGRYETQIYRGEINLSRIPVGGVYTVEYQLDVNAQHIGSEGLAQAYLGDPLDVDGGVWLETGSAEVDDEEPALCRAQSDPTRFLYNDGDGTATDTYSGLMWQRCPMGYSLNDNGSANDLSDDVCEPESDAAVTWREALQLSGSDAGAGYDDWRLPNIKELASIVAPECHAPTIDRATFPGRVTGFFWSSTPDPLAGDAVESLQFSLGLSSSLAKTSLAHVRLVRTSDTPPVRPLPGLYVGRPTAVTEGDSGATDMVFAVELDRESSGDVTAHYETRDHTAVAGADYFSTSGTLNIPAGARSAEIIVPVTGDAEAENDEALYLALSQVSANARLVIGTNLGQIEDDEPVVTIASATAVEGNAGITQLTFDVLLNRASPTDVTLDYTTSDATASAGIDYGAASGTARVPAGATSTSIPVSILGDADVEADEAFTLTLSNVSPNAKLGNLLADGAIIDDDVVTSRALNDTGIVFCADEIVRVVSCASTADLPGQDAQFGRDATDSSNDDGVAGFSFEKLDASGTALADQAAPYTVTPWVCVRDEVTGLWWEIRTDDEGLRDKDWAYSWYNSSGVNDGGGAGIANGGFCADGLNCDTEKYVSAVNAAGLCGRNDWRLPTRDELQSIVDFSDTNSPPYDTSYFHHSVDLPNPRDFWTQTPVSSAADSAWSISNIRGNANSFHGKATPLKVRLVRGDP